MVAGGEVQICTPHHGSTSRRLSGIECEPHPVALELVGIRTDFRLYGDVRPMI